MTGDSHPQGTKGTMQTAKAISALFSSDVTRDIPPVVYFNDQAPARLASEVDEYIITGGWPEGHAHQRRVPDGIHEQYVRLLTGITRALAIPGGPTLPTAWISGFYGSGKSSFAKLLGMALDGVKLPDGRSMAEAWLARDTSPRRDELVNAWSALREQIDPMAVVFDIGTGARDNEHIHSAALRQVQQRLGYCAHPAVADFELKLERDGQWDRFVALAEEHLDQPWSTACAGEFAEEDFSLVMHHFDPKLYIDPLAWFSARAGMRMNLHAPEEAVQAMADMLAQRAPRATLFLVIDEVSQYVLANKDRVDRLRAFANALGAGLRGKGWLLALGQQTLDEEADDSFLVWARDRFPKELRVHLATTNIRDVVHRRLLHKAPAHVPALEALFDAHRADLKLFAFGGESITPDAFVETYPMLPGQIDLILRITTALRNRSARAQGDAQAIRGLLQLLGELFRAQKLADKPVGTLVTLEDVYAVQHTALDADTQGSMARVLDKCADDTPLHLKVAKVVALLELIQDTDPTSAELVAQCLYDRVDRGNQVAAVTAALEDLRRRNLLGYAEKTGYKLQSSAAEEWERQRREIGVGREKITAQVEKGLKTLLGVRERPRLQGRPFPWAGRFSDGRLIEDARLVDPREDAVITVDLRWLTVKERTHATWIRRSAETTLRDRIVWVAGDDTEMERLCREVEKSRRMVARHQGKGSSLDQTRRVLLAQEENRLEDLIEKVAQAIESTWMGGQMYFRGRSFEPRTHGASFQVALNRAGESVLPDVFTHFVAARVQPSGLKLLVNADLSTPPAEFLDGPLQIFELDAGRYHPTCKGELPQRVLEWIASERGVSGELLLKHFGRPPFGYPADLVKASVLGLLRGRKLAVRPEGGAEIKAIIGMGVNEFAGKDRVFRRATIAPAGEGDLTPKMRAKICRLFDAHLGHAMDREDHAIADGITSQFPEQVRRVRAVLTRIDRLPGKARPAKMLRALLDVLERAIANARHTTEAVKGLSESLDVLRDGFTRLDTLTGELTDAAVAAVLDAKAVLDGPIAQLIAAEVAASNVDAARARIQTQLALDAPWRGVADLEQDLIDARAAYRSERESAIAWMGAQADAARGRLRKRAGFATLSADDANTVLRFVHRAEIDTSPDALTPPLAELKSRFTGRLTRAETLANDAMDDILSAGKIKVVAVDLNLGGRELGSAEDIEGMLAEVRKRLMDLIDDTTRIRLVR